MIPRVSTRRRLRWLLPCLVLGQVSVAHGAETGADLTLVPPSPVTDQIVLDIRSAIRNPAEMAKTFDVAVYLDMRDQDHRLHHETIDVPARAARGVSFRWPTGGRPGRHEIILSVRCDSAEGRTTRPLEILASSFRSTGRIDGAWAGIYHWSEEEGRLWNAEIRKMSDDQWRELVRAMHEIRMDIVVIGEAFRNQMYVGRHAIERDGYHGKAFYPSRLVPGRMAIAARDPIEAILSEADTLGMHVFLPVGLYAWFDFTPGSLDWHREVATELYDLYGKHPSFYGWYVVEEIAGNLGADPQRRNEIVEFFRAFRTHVRTLAPDKPVMLASNCHSVPQALDVYPKLLEHLDILCPFGFHRMPAGDITGEEAAAILQRLCDQAGAHLWMDLEVFLFGEANALYPRPIDGLVGDLRRFPNFEKILCYQFPGLMNAPQMSRRPGGPATVKLYLDYRQFIDRQPAIPR